MFGLDWVHTLNLMALGALWLALGPIIITNLILYFWKGKYRFGKEVEAIVDWLFVTVYTVLTVTNLMIPGFLWFDILVFLLVVPYSAYSGWHEVAQVRDSYRTDRAAKDLVDAQRMWLGSNGYRVSDAGDAETISIVIERIYPGGYTHFVNTYWLKKDMEE